MVYGAYFRFPLKVLKDKGQFFLFLQNTEYISMLDLQQKLKNLTQGQDYEAWNSLINW